MFGRRENEEVEEEKYVIACFVLYFARKVKENRGKIGGFNETGRVMTDD